MKHAISRLLLATGMLLIACGPTQNETPSNNRQSGKTRSKKANPVDTTNPTSCTGKGVDSGQGKLGLLPIKKMLWSATKDTRSEIKVCWMPYQQSYNHPNVEYKPNHDALLQERKKWVREAVEAQWNQQIGISFVGWEDCRGDDKETRIYPMDSLSKPTPSMQPGRSFAESNSDHLKNNIYLNVFFGDEQLFQSRYYQDTKRFWMVNGNQSRIYNFPPASEAGFGLWAKGVVPGNGNKNVDINDQANVNALMDLGQKAVQNVAVHEFGHILGFTHEQYRTDSPNAAVCADKYNKLYGAAIDDYKRSIEQYKDEVPLGAFDAESIMSYCRSKLDPVLSAIDLSGALQLYPIPQSEIKKEIKMAVSDPINNQCE